jgi:hypothetical protein
MVRLSCALALFLGAVCLFSASQETSAPVFRSGTSLVLVQFNVIRGGYFTKDVKQEDIRLLEDGKPRVFSRFEGPGGRPPLELAVMFDTTTLSRETLADRPVIAVSHWDRKATYAFAHDWSDAESRAVLEKDGADVRVSIYRYDHRQLQRLCRSTKDPGTLTAAIRRLLEPVPAGEAIQLALPPGRETIDSVIARTQRSPYGNVWFFWPSWTQEAMIGALEESLPAESNSVRALIVFSEALGPTTTTPQDVAERASALGMTVYPIVLNFGECVNHPVSWGHANTAQATAEWADAITLDGDVYLPETIPMVRFGRLGELSGGRAFYPSRINVGVIDDILNGIRNEIRSQYVVAVTPDPSGTQRQHKLEVKLASKALGTLVGGKKTATY